MFLYLLTRYMRPEGPWQRLCRCPRGQQRFFLTPFKDRIPSPTTMGHTGATLSPPHDPPDKKRRYQLDKGKKTKEKYSLGRARPSLLAFRHLPDTLPVIHFRPKGPGPNRRVLQKVNYCPSGSSAG